jgi:hypothetical protein
MGGGKWLRLVLLPQADELVLRGRPPKRPLLRDASAFALLFALPPAAPMCDIHCLVPKMPLIKLGTYKSASKSGQ